MFVGYSTLALSPSFRFSLIRVLVVSHEPLYFDDRVEVQVVLISGICHFNRLGTYYNCILLLSSGCIPLPTMYNPHNTQSTM